MATEEEVERFAGAALDKIADDERSLAWLSRQTGIAESTLAYQLKKPSAMSLRTALGIARALGIQVERVAA